MTISMMKTALLCQAITHQIRKLERLELLSPIKTCPLKRKRGKKTKPLLFLLVKTLNSLKNLISKMKTILVKLDLMTSQQVSWGSLGVQSSIRIYLLSQRKINYFLKRRQIFNLIIILQQLKIQKIDHLRHLAA